MSQKQLINIYNRLSCISNKTYKHTAYYNHSKDIVKAVDIHVKRSGDYYDAIHQLLNFLYHPEYCHIKDKKNSNL